MKQACQYGLCWLRPWMLALGVFTAQSALAADKPVAETPSVGAAKVDTEHSGATENAEATLQVLNHDIITFRASLAGVPPALRVERTRARLRDIPASEIDAPLHTLPFALGDARGVQFFLGNRLLFSALEGDVDKEAKQSFEDLVKTTQANLVHAHQTWHEMRDTPLLLKGLLRAVLATLVLGALIAAVYFLSRKVVQALETMRDRLAQCHDYIDWREFLGRLAVGLMKLVQWLVLLALGYAWLSFVLESFALTEPLARHLSGWFWGQIHWVGNGFIDSLPGLMTVVIVLFITRAIADLLGYFFEAVHQGRVEIPFLHPETTTATKRLVTVVVWGLGVAVAYPYLPGSSSEAFKGLSVLFGLMITLGSSGLVTQAMSGLVVIYSRALRKGDFVEVNGVQGVVAEVAVLATKIVSVRNEEITIPNSVLIGNPIHNYSKLADSQGTLLTTQVTIGYDAPWREVHALLIDAAQKTPGLRATPTPYVYQRALSDFYVEYELFASIDNPIERVPVLSALHANIQDAFNEHGIQIMSPHFLNQPDQPVLGKA